MKSWLFAVGAFLSFWSQTGQAAQAPIVWGSDSGQTAAKLLTTKLCFLDATCQTTAGGGGGGSGTVTSVGLSLPAIFSVSGSPVTTSGTLTGTLSSQPQNQIFAGPAAAPSGVPSFRPLVAADIPSLDVSKITQFNSVVGKNQFWGGPSASPSATPSFRPLVGADLPNPSSSTLGGIQSYSSVLHQWINTISTSGVPSSSQPAFTDISGTAVETQGGTNQTTYAIGDLLYASASNVLSKLPHGSTAQAIEYSSTGIPAAVDRGDPTSQISWCEDFIGYTNNTQQLTVTSSGVSVTDNHATESVPDGTSVGIVFYTMSATNSFLVLSPSGNSVNLMALGGGVLKIKWRFYIPTLSNSTDRYTLFLGGGNSVNASAITKGVGVLYSDNVNSGNWQGQTIQASTTTSNNSAIAVTAGAWHTVQILSNVAGTAVDFYVDGVNFGTNTTNLPNAYPQVFTAPYLQWVKTAGSGAVTLLLDYGCFWKNVTR